MTRLLNKTFSNGLSMRHIAVVLTCAVLCFTCSGMVFNTWSIFIVPISHDLNVETNQFTLNVSIIYLSAALMASPMGNLMEKYDLRALFSFSVICCALGFLLGSCWTEVWQFYLSGILEGIGVVTITYLGAPTIVNRWFNIHMGLLVGFCVAMAGIGGATWSLVGGYLIAGLDWRAAYLCYGSFILILCIPLILLFIRSYPSDAGLKPYGATYHSYRNTLRNRLFSSFKKQKLTSRSEGKTLEQECNQASSQLENVCDASCDTSNSKEKESSLIWGTSAKEAFRSPAFYTLALTIALFNATGQAGNLFPTYVYHLGDLAITSITASNAIMIASFIAMCMHIAQAIAKITLGAIADRTIIIALFTACGGGALGIILVWQGVFYAENCLYLGSILFGFLYGATNVLGPTITRKLFGAREYTKIYSRIAMIINIAPAISTTAFTTLTQISWDLEFGVVMGLIALIFALSLTTVYLGKSIKQTLEPRTN